MKIRAEVIAVETHGDSLKVALQGSASRDAFWRPLGKHSLTVPATARNGRLYHIGRVIVLDARPGT